MLVLIAVLVRQKYLEVFDDQGRLEVIQPQAAPDTVIFSWQSDIDVPMQKRFSEAYAEWRGKVRRIIIALNSPGGSLVEGRKVIQLIERMKRTHEVDTFVAAGAMCLSMCVPIYLQGQTRIASNSSKWMFHAPSKYEIISDEKVAEPERERIRAANRFFERYFENSGASQQWFASIRQQWQSGEDIWRTGGELVREKANIVQVLQNTPL